MRERAGLLPHTEVEFIVEPDGVRIIKVENAHGPSRGAMAVDRLRQTGGGITLSTEEIMEWTRGEP